MVPFYFSLQPGAAYLSKGARIIYPNIMQLAPGTRVGFWDYDPKNRGWHIYGYGHVTKNGRRIVPNPGVRVWEFTGAMALSYLTPPWRWPKPGPGPHDGDPVDLGTGMFVYGQTDLHLDDTIPATVTRTYARQIRTRTTSAKASSARTTSGSTQCRTPRTRTSSFPTEAVSGTSD